MPYAVLKKGHPNRYNRGGDLKVNWLSLRGRKTRFVVGPAFRAVCFFNRVKVSNYNIWIPRFNVFSCYAFFYGFIICILCV
jgi:hypothetical protein